jgi:hypothetical protein
LGKTGLIFKQDHPFATLGCPDNRRPLFLQPGYAAAYTPDFSVVLFRPNFMLASEGYPMKAHKNQRLLTLPSPPNLPCGATNQGTYHGVWWADAFAVT